MFSLVELWHTGKLRITKSVVVVIRTIDQVAKAKAEGEALRVQLRQALSSKDGSGQVKQENLWTASSVVSCGGLETIDGLRDVFLFFVSWGGLETFEDVRCWCYCCLKLL